MPIFRTVCCLLALAIAPSLLSAEESPLVWKFQAGEALKYRMTQEMQLKMALGNSDRSVETSTDQVIDLSWQVEQVDEQGQAQLLQSINRIQMDLQAPGQPEMHYDTAKKESPSGFAAMLVPLFQALAEQPIAMTISPRGEILEMEVPDEVAQAAQAIPGAAMLGEMFSEEGFKQMIQKNSLILPQAEDLTPGHQWTSTSKMKNAQFGEIASETTYRYVGPREVSGKTYEVFEISMKMNFGEGPEGMQVETEVLESEGEILFNREAGRLESSELHQEMKMRFSMGEQTMTQNLATTVTMKHVSPNESSDNQ